MQLRALSPAAHQGCACGLCACVRFRQDSRTAPAAVAAQKKCLRVMTIFNQPYRTWSQAESRPTSDRNVCAKRMCMQRRECVCTWCRVEPSMQAVEGTDILVLRYVQSSLLILTSRCCQSVLLIKLVHTRGHGIARLTQSPLAGRHLEAKSQKTGISTAPMFVKLVVRNFLKPASLNQPRSCPLEGESVRRSQPGSQGAACSRSHSSCERCECLVRCI